jgi:hypothetical protein
VLPHPTNHLDITATIVELAHATAPTAPPLDGLSFVAELAAPAAPAALGDKWRQHSFSEFFGAFNTWQLVRVVNSTHKFSYMWWCTNDTEVFNMKGDEWQMENVDGKQGDAFAVQAAQSAGRLAAPLGQCTGHACSYPQPAALPSNGSLPCYVMKPAGYDYMGDFKFKIDPKTKAVGIKGWAVDLSSRLPGKKNGTEPVIVELRVNGKFGKIPAQVANIPRADIPKANPKIPDPAHGFQYTTLPAALLKGVQKIVLFGKVGEDGALNPLGGSPKQPVLKRCLCDGTECPCS